MLLLYILNLYSVRYEYEDFVKNIKFHMFYFWLKTLTKSRLGCIITPVREFVTILT